ncbi:MAG: bifunctional phosphoribosylaminoimidazolecarboxamide formyltransferase/IMP cyclohydrolase [Mariniblastus sp.]|nr:bifunctional phosphoribosylaminoimidazolecarboxamide formyltransferase/IMP cyclohydrolase [Mariniblastus sp.]
MESPKIKRALISVSNKMGLTDFARGLSEAGIELYSTGGTRRHLESSDIPVTDVASYTGFPEMMDGRVKTLHPKIFAGILARRHNDSDVAALEEHEIATFDLVVVNLYPFAATIAKPNVLIHEAIEQIDIGGPSLVRAAAKNSDFVTVVTDPEQYWSVLEEIQAEGKTTARLRTELMAKAFQHTADYDKTISEYFSRQTEGEKFPATLQHSFHRQVNLRYGENNHQSAALYSSNHCDEANLVNARQLNGKQLSYNNLLDLDSALAMVRSLDQPACSVIKHNNPCGAATAATLLEACRAGLAGDPLSAFGSVIAFNRIVDVETANFLSDGDFFVEAIVAPGFFADAIDVLKTRPKWKKNVRLLQVGELSVPQPRWECRQILGGMLVQDADNQPDDPSDWKVATDVQLDDRLMAELAFGWHMVRFVKSNAITLSKDRALVGVGAGQMSRVDSVEIAIRKAGERAAGSVLASDAFFPFPDSIEVAADANIAGIIQPGGSVRDDEVIAACNQHGIPLVLTGTRHFRH